MHNIFSDTLAVGYDSDPDTWDEPLKRRSHAASQHIRNSLQNAHIDQEIPQQCEKPTQELINLPYCRDPSQPVKKIPTDTGSRSQLNYSPVPYNRQSYGNIQPQAWDDAETTNRPMVYKKKHAPSTPSNKSKQFTPLPPRAQSPKGDDDWQFPKLTPIKCDINKNLYGGSMPSDINNPIEELQKLVCAKSNDFITGDDPPFNFQAMLRKTPRNRASMKRVGESPTLIPMQTSVSPILDTNIDTFDQNTPEPVQDGPPSRPKSCQGFKRMDSIELFKMAVKRTDSSQSFKTCVTNGNVGETVQLAPGITVEGYVVDL